MASRQAVRLGTVAKTLLVALYARAVESRRKHPILDDPRAVEMVESKCRQRLDPAGDLFLR